MVRRGNVLAEAEQSLNRC